MAALALCAGRRFDPVLQTVTAGYRAGIIPAAPSS